MENKLIELCEVKRITTLSKSTIYLMMNSGKFPSPIKVGLRRVAWNKQEVLEWISNLNKVCETFEVPSDKEIIDSIASVFNVKYDVAEQWINAIQIKNKLNSENK